MPGKSNTQVRTGFWSYVPQYRGVSKKSEGASVVTLQDLVVPTPFKLCGGSIRLTLKNKAKDKSEPEAIQEAKASLEGIFQNSAADLDLVEDSEQEAMESNEKLLDDIFDGIERRLRLLRTDVMKKFRTLTPEQKKEVVKFWKAVEEFLDILLDWINKMFLKVLENIRQGSVIEKDALKKIFERVSEFLKVIFRT
ncbi:hypothetical protein JTE90_004243 [Oedothorax gibbosus]|nr:hypothetical protein JTE90_004243 [Oedothorax gibbosus]